MLKVYGDVDSGNCYKVKLLLHLLNVPCEWVNVDILKGETRTQEFLAMNPNGKIPALELDNGEFLSESNAILCYLSDGTEYVPADKLQRARVMQWLFFEQYSHEPNIATSRYIIRYLGRPKEREADLDARSKPGYAALDVMEQHLRTRHYFVGGRYSIADIGLYAYTHVAEEGDFDLSRFEALRSWLGRVQSHPRHVKMNG